MTDERARLTDEPIADQRAPLTVAEASEALDFLFEDAVAAQPAVDALIEAVRVEERLRWMNAALEIGREREAERERHRALLEAASKYIVAGDVIETDVEGELVEQINNLESARAALRAALEALEAK